MLVLLNFNPILLTEMGVSTESEPLKKRQRLSLKAGRLKKKVDVPAEPQEHNNNAPR